MLAYVSSGRATQRIHSGNKNMPLAKRPTYDRKVRTSAEDETITYGNNDFLSYPERPELSGGTQLVKVLTSTGKYKQVHY